VGIVWGDRIVVWSAAVEDGGDVWTRNELLSGLLDFYRSDYLF
jgi:hypothetical protein